MYGKLLSEELKHAENIDELKLQEEFLSLGETPPWHKISYFSQIKSYIRLASDKIYDQFAAISTGFSILTWVRKYSFEGSQP